MLGGKSQVFAGVNQVFSNKFMGVIIELEYFFEEVSKLPDSDRKHSVLSKSLIMRARGYSDPGLRCGLDECAARALKPLPIFKGHFGRKGTVFVLIPTHAPTSTHPSYFKVINHKMNNHLPRSFHKAYIPSSFWLGFSLKQVKIISVWSILATNSEINKRLPKTIYLSTLGASWNEYGTHFYSLCQRLGFDLVCGQGSECKAWGEWAL